MNEAAVQEIQRTGEIIEINGHRIHGTYITFIGVPVRGFLMELM